MDSGKIILTDKELSLMKKSKISLTELGTSVDDFKEGFVIPLTHIKKSHNELVQGIYIVKIETRDGHLFSITTANAKNIGKEGSIHLNGLINSTTILSNNRKNMSPSTNVSKIEQDPNICSYCGEEFDPSWKFCRNCGNKI
ncbi:MAG: zinc ribbon domain-containing protein [Candidatus Lokiarchaeota archaeon]|nr:zinc ribbon domain-containing protein [Candidatus Lokiarchaeota archaeon]